ncbi:MAG TPA: DegT/DnrJ/EryC1/StrS family aminotransferase [Candidatus Methanoperedens sp.]|nr:DegT/DnrJ/EryC1/StrS family aminotransferase [Candidatus Methanoperedens sp.]
MIPFIDLSCQHRPLEASFSTVFAEVLRGAQYILGPAVGRFEEEMAQLHGVRHAIGCASGTDALLLGLLGAGVRPGDEVITTPFTFVATAEVIEHADARPVFVDIDEATFNLDPEQIEAVLTERTRAIIPVHLYGLACDMTAIARVAARHKLKVVEDCAQATGSRWLGRLVGGFGDAGAFSFFPTKNLGAIGDGGMVLTDNDTLAEKVRMLRGHGAKVRDHYELLGYNSRLDSLQAAVLSVKLPLLEGWNRQRRANAARYRELLGGLDALALPVETAGAEHTYNQFSILTSRRDELRAHLQERGVPTMVYYPRALHQQPIFAHLGYATGDFPVTERIQEEVLSLPIFPGLTEEQIDTVAGAIKEFFAKN